MSWPGGEPDRGDELRFILRQESAIGAYKAAREATISTIAG